MTESTVNVLAVLDAHVDSCANRRDEALRAGDNGMAAYWRAEVKAARYARAAVAELIEAARDDADARDQETTDERLGEIAGKVCDYAPTLEQVRKETAKRLSIALARVGGGE